MKKRVGSLRLNRETLKQLEGGDNQPPWTIVQQPTGQRCSDGCTLLECFTYTRCTFPCG